MYVWTITTNTFGEPRLFGVYEDAKGAYKAAEHLSFHADPEDEFRIRYTEVEETKDVIERVDSCEANRRQALEEAVEIELPEGSNLTKQSITDRPD